jgi:hypothetical protein
MNATTEVVDVPMPDLNAGNFEEAVEEDEPTLIQYMFVSIRKSRFNFLLHLKG